MALEYYRKAKIHIPSIHPDPAVLVDCIVVDCITWDGPLYPGQTGKHKAEIHHIPIGQQGLAFGRTVKGYDEQGKLNACIAPSCKNYHDAIGKRVSWAKPPVKVN